MIIYLTSDPGGAWDENGHPVVRKFKKENNFIHNLRYSLRSVSGSIYNSGKCLLVAANPDSHTLNDEHRIVFDKAFKKAMIRFSEIDVCDSRDTTSLTHLSDYSLIFLMGGYAPCQNRFFEDIELRKYLSEYQGILLTLSAGSMNCADVVYMAPEQPSDFAVPTENRFVPGLGLTNIQIVPHFQYLQTLCIDGQSLVEDIIVPDSAGHNFTGLVDGSYFIIDTCTGQSILHGAAYHIQNQKIRPY